MNLQEVRKDFKSKDEEIAFLKSLLAEKEIQNTSSTNSFANALKFGGKEDVQDKEHKAREILAEYRKTNPADVLKDNFRLSEDHITTVALGLQPEEHDDKLQKMIDVFTTEGVRNSFSILAKLADPHLEDDFHRFLVQYVLKFNEKASKKFGSYKETFRATDATLFQVTLQTEKITDTREQNNQSNQFQVIQQNIQIMERFYTGMLSIADADHYDKNKNYFTVEIAKSLDSNQIKFYVSVPNEFKDLFKKQVLALYPQASLEEQPDDYNVFVPNGFSVGAYGESGKTPAFPIKTYKDIAGDSVSVVLSSMSQLEDDEGAAIQIVIKPMGDKYIKQYGKMLDKVNAGKKSIRQILASQNVWGEMKTEFFDMFKSQETLDKELKSHDHQDASKQISEKMNTTIFATNVRLIASSGSAIRSAQIVHQMTSTFKQYTDTRGNYFKFKEVKGRKTHDFFKHYSYRYFDDTENFPLNASELSTIYHFPKNINERDFAELKQFDSAQAPAPADLPKGAMSLGKNIYRHKETEIFFQDESRVRHMYVIGQTGTGKSVYLKNMIIQDIEQGNGLCFIDPHGSDVQDILKFIPKDRIDDVIYFDPGDLSRPFGLNMLEYDVTHPEQKTLIVNELLSIFNKLFDMKVAGGPAFEQYFRNSALLVMEDPESGNTLMEISRVLSDPDFRRQKMEKCKNPLVKQFFSNAEATSGEQSFENYVPYVTNKFDNFLSNEFMRPILAQEKSTLDFKDIMQNKKILLVNLSKGKLGELGSFLLGLIIVGKILINTFARDPKDNPPPFYLYLDEFQNVATDSIQQILSEARKYKLGLILAHQYIKQIDEKIRNAVFGNVGSMAIFRIEPEDAKFVENYFSPTFSAKDIIGQSVGNCYLKILANNKPQKPFNLKVPWREGGSEEIRDVVKELSALKYGTPLEEINEVIMKKFGI